MVILDVVQSVAAGTKCSNCSKPVKALPAYAAGKRIFCSGKCAKLFFTKEK